MHFVLFANEIITKSTASAWSLWWAIRAFFPLNQNIPLEKKNATNKCIENGDRRVQRRQIVWDTWLAVLGI